MNGGSPDRPNILVVEDEHIVSLFMLELLEDAGFAVHAAETARSALKHIGEPEPLAAAIVDLGLPDMRGEELVARIRDQRPHLPLVIATGYDTGRYRHRFQEDANVRVLAKPFDAPELLTTLDSLRVRQVPQPDPAHLIRPG